MAFPAMQGFRGRGFSPSAHARARAHAYGSESNPVVIAAAAPTTSFTPVNAARAYPYFSAWEEAANGPASPTLPTYQPQSPVAYRPLSPVQYHPLSPVAYQPRPQLQPPSLLPRSLPNLTLTLPPLSSYQLPPPLAPNTLVHAPAGPPLKPLDRRYILPGQEVSEKGGEDGEKSPESKAVLLPEGGTVVEARGEGVRTVEGSAYEAVRGAEVQVTGESQSQSPAWSTTAVRHERIGARESERERQAYEPVRRVLENEPVRRVLETEPAAHQRQQGWRMTGQQPLERKGNGVSKSSKMDKPRVSWMAQRLRMSMSVRDTSHGHTSWTAV